MNIREFFSAALQSFSTNTTPQVRRSITASKDDTYNIADGITIYRRPNSAMWQCRFRLNNGEWHRLSTGCLDFEGAQIVAIKLNEQWIARQEFGLPVKCPQFSTVASQVAEHLANANATGNGKVVYKDYIAVIEKYLIPYFGRMTFEQMTADVMAEFDAWRATKIKKNPTASTLRTHASAFNRVIEFAERQGLLPHNRAKPSLNTRGRASQPRPAFDQKEIDHLLVFMEAWGEEGRLNAEQLIRPVLRDYVEFLINTGIRHGTEARRVEWRHLQWHYEGETRFLRVWVSGKTGPRYLIGKNGAIPALERCAKRTHGVEATLEKLIEEASSELVFICGNGYQPYGFEGSFRRLMRDSKLLKDASGKNRTLYSLRHTYATFTLRDGISIHTIARQMGTSVLMLEKHYSKLTPMMNAAELSK